jgi:hypothetical protein
VSTDFEDFEHKPPFPEMLLHYSPDTLGIKALSTAIFTRLCFQHLIGMQILSHDVTLLTDPAYKCTPGVGANGAVLYLKLNYLFIIWLILNQQSRVCIHAHSNHETGRCPTPIRSCPAASADGDQNLFVAGEEIHGKVGSETVKA